VKIGSNWRKIVALGAATALAATLVLQAGPLVPAGAEGETVYSVGQVVQLSTENDLTKKITDMEYGLKNQRAAYTPNGFSSWTGTYTYTIGPLIQSANTALTNYQNTTNANYTAEYSYYAAAYGLWLSGQSLQYQLANYNLASHEKEITQLKLDQGTASQNDMMKAEISYNKAKADYLKADYAYQQLLISTNLRMNTPLTQQFNVNDVDLAFFSDDELAAGPLLNDLYLNHQSLVPLKQFVDAYQRAYEIAEGQTDPHIPIEGLMNYYALEKQEAQYRLQLAQKGVEKSIYEFSKELPVLQAAIQLDQESAAKMSQVYENAAKRYEVGMSTFDDMETVRLNLLQMQLQLASDQQNYLLKKEKFRLFKAGATFQ
jgi:hypothetical protein